jgi:DNA gyrase/topoisomerase IV subunit A
LFGFRFALNGICYPCRYEVVEKRAKFQLAKALKRLHLVEGFLIVTHSLDLAVQTIRRAQDSTDAIERLRESLGLSDEQAAGVMNLTLRRLTSLEVGKIKSERDQLNDS